MKRRTRLIAGIFALVAMTSALAETLLASTCEPGMDMQSQTAVAAEAPAEDCLWAASHDREGDPDQNEPHCPFSHAAATQGCTAVVSLPSHAIPRIAPSLEGLVGVFVEQTGLNLLLVSAPFHPPRA